MCVKFSNIKVTNRKKMYFCAVKAEGKGLSEKQMLFYMRVLCYKEGLI